MPKNKRLKFLIVARGPGETGQARSLARYIRKRGFRVIFALHQKINYPFVAKDKKFLKIYITENPKKLRKLIEKIKPDVLLLFNSKMWGGLKDFPVSPYPPAIVICIDSNWLFNHKRYPYYPYVPWADRYLINISPKIFRLGLKEYGGHFVISPAVKNKVEAVGFIPTYKIPTQSIKSGIRKKYGLKKDEKLIFSYFSGFGAAHRLWAFNNLIAAIDTLIKRGRKIKVVYIGETENLSPQKRERPWLILKEQLDAEEYYALLASSDLVFQHQGLVTLTQAICAQRPVIANVTKLSKERIPNIHFWEVEPFVRAGVCHMLNKSTPLQKISKEIEALLYNRRIIRKMQLQQIKNFKPGETAVYQIIMRLLKNKHEKIKDRPN